MNRKVLLVDDDHNILAGYKRRLRKVFDIHVTDSGRKALKALAGNGPYSVICSDLRMPEMDGLELLALTKKKAPDTVRMMLTGNADLNAAIDAVNEGNIFRFLTKPCKSAVLARAIADGVKQYQLIISERELLNKTLRGSIRILTDILSLVNPEAFGRASSIAEYAKQVAEHMHLEPIWEYETAAMLSQIGCITLPKEIMEKIFKGKPLTEKEQKLYNEHPQVAADLIGNLPRLEKIREIVRLQNGPAGPDDGHGDDRDGEPLPMGARILKAVIDLEAGVALGMSKGRSLMNMKEQAEEYDSGVLMALERILGDEADYDRRSVGVYELQENMIIAENVYTRDGKSLLVAKDHHLTQTLIKYIRNHNRIRGIQGPIQVLVPFS